MKRWLKFIFRKLLKIALYFLLITVSIVIIYKYIDPPVSGMMLYKKVTIDDYHYEYEWRDLEEINSSLPLAFIAAEDQKFLDHNGFDVEAIEKAVKHNKSSERKRGASTISQQVAKNVFLIPAKNYFRKGLEVYFTGLIELIWGKRRIMEVYLNVVELGEGIYGAEAAAQHYYKKQAVRLNRNQTAFMATVLPNPLKFNLARPSAYMYRRQTWILRQMNNLGGESILKKWYE